MQGDTEKYYKDAKVHYDYVTDAWKDFMGDHFHFGYYETEDTEHSKAVVALTDKMLALCDISKDSRILDVGCGIGGPAFYIHEKFKCAIDGISTSSRGIELANATSEEKGYDNVQFKVADGLSNGFPDNTFDIVWVMESSHLMRDKRKLLQECFRVLKKDGTIVLCDLISLVLLPFPISLIKQVKELKTYFKLVKSFGPAQISAPGIYCNLFVYAGFDEISFFNISQNSIPTLKSWKNNALQYGKSEGSTISRDYVNEFIQGCDILEDLFKRSFFGYGIFRAVK
jgi:27-O-demethylrifamycin SV methyltransferase